MKRNILTILVLTSLTVACSSDDDYESRPPRFSDVTVRNLAGSTNIHAGDRVVVTAVQQKRGHLLNRTSYDWAVSPSEGIRDEKHRAGVVYDNEPQNPTDTFTVTTQGAYNVSLKARYSISGQAAKGYNYTETFDNGSVTYAGSALYYHVDIHKIINVLP